MIEITHDVLDAESIASRVKHDAAGAVVTFLGTTRDHTGDRRVLYLEYEAYRPMADQQLARVAEEMGARWDLTGVAIAHRLGRLDRAAWRDQPGGCGVRRPPEGSLRGLPLRRRPHQADRAHLEEGALRGWRGLGGYPGGLRPARGAGGGAARLVHRGARRSRGRRR